MPPFLMEWVDIGFDGTCFDLIYFQAFGMIPNATVVKVLPGGIRERFLI